MDKYIGQRYGSLTVTKIAKAEGRKVYLFTCDCGEHRESIIGNVVHGTIKACKTCTARNVAEANKRKATRHGMSGSGMYQSWKCMKSRCKDTTHPHYSKLSISYCPEWEEFTAFRTWALANGWQEGLTIDRIDPDKGYYPENCQWLTRQENSARARRVNTK